MKRNELVRKIATMEKKIADLNEERKSVRESLNAYKTILEMSDNGQLDILEESAK